MNSNSSSKLSLPISGSGQTQTKTKPTIYYKKLSFEGKPLIILRKQPKQELESIPKPKPEFENENHSVIVLRKLSRPQADDSQSWSIQYLIDELTISLLEIYVEFCMLGGLEREARKQDLRNLGRGVLRRLYEEQARYKMYRIPVFRPPPVFVIYLKHLNNRVKQELSGLDWETKDFVMREAIGRVFEQVDGPFFLLSVKSLLQWRFEN
jgi:hypothetical protein